MLSVTRKSQVGWDHAAGDLDTHLTFEVKIDHGGYISTAVHGISSVSVPVGQYVTRGDLLGYARTTEIFFQLFYRQSALDPSTYSTFFRGFDGGKVTGKGRKLRAGPDFVARALSDTVSYLMGGIRYFVDKYCTKPDLLVSIDFNGDGSKAGFGVTGFAANDHWNAYTPVSFSTTSGYLCFSVLNPPTEVANLSVEATTSPLSFYDGTLFETVGIGTWADAGTSSATWLYGSTETVPEMAYADSSAAFVSGTTYESVYTLSESESAGTQSFSFLSGTLFDSVQFAFGTDAPGVGSPYDESAGTQSFSFLSGTLFDSVQFAFGTDAPGVGSPYDESAGTQAVSWLSGGTNTFVFPQTFIESVGTSVVSFGTGVVRQY
ncbi:MAG: hypothetical protein ACOYB3_00880 [Azonexus sp.]